MTWEAHIDYEFLNGEFLRLHIAQPRHGSTDYWTGMTEDGSALFRTVQEGQRIDSAGVLLPLQALEAVKKELDKFFGPPPNDYKSMYEEAIRALEIERQRVNWAMSGRPEL